MLQKNRVLMSVYAYYKEDTRVRREAEALVDNGFEVDVICMNQGGEETYERFNGVNIIRTSMVRSTSKRKISYITDYLLFFFLSMWHITVNFAQRRPRTIFVHNMPNFLVFAAVIPRLFGAKVILDLHDIMPELYSALFNLKDGWLKKLLFIEEKLSGLFASRLIATNTQMAKVFTQRIGKACFLVHNTPDSRIISRQRAPDHQVSSPFLLFHHGNVQDRYGTDRIFPVMKKLNGGDTIQVRFEMHGRGPFYETLKQRATDAGVANECEFHGGFKPEAIDGHIIRADVGLVLNHTNAFNDLILPVKALEYIQCKVPVICPKTSVLTDYFDDSMVYFFTTEEEIEQQVLAVMADPELAKAKAERAYQAYEKISWENESRRLVAFVNDL